MSQSVETATHLLTWYNSKIEALGKLHLLSEHQKAENFFRDLLNLIHDWDLTNANYKNPNAKAIDLESEKYEIAIQVSSQDDKEKIDHTLNGFFDPKTSYKEKYNQLVLLTIGKNKNTNFAEHEKKYSKKHSDSTTLFPYQFTFKIWDIHNILKEIEDKTYKQEVIVQFLQERIDPLKEKERRKECNEVETIMRLIDFLSHEEFVEIEFESEIDPSHKIEKRFSDCSDELKQEYIDLVSIYGQALTESESKNPLTGFTSKKVGVYLKRLSNNILTKNQGNPKIALDELTNFFEEKIGSQFQKYDVGAIRFYLVNQLIRCNVFPNIKK